MEANSSFNSSNSYPTQNWVDADCGCGVRAPVRTSHSYANPGRRFQGCVNYQDPMGCKFFKWVDPQTCPRGLVYGRHLLNKIGQMEKRDEDLKRLLEVAEMDKEKLMKKIDKLSRMNEALRKKNEALEKKNEVIKKCMLVLVIVVGICVSLCLCNRKPMSGSGMYLYLP
ncbi:hypothetical protein Vadar_033592 [Vaccinium darrowii]|uniref:Uncharacterized protein n=1 Tax=Vaccinium darrowii TaxID=229202 RepID=A0ACB7YRZ9_9ERIC|nr:hypothetical protein Vadar_033592 [Vaccinium darrowii]